MTLPTAHFHRVLWLTVVAFASFGPFGLAHAEEPAKLAGTWTWTWKDRNGATHRHVLEVEGVGEKLAAREIFDDQAPVRATDLKLDNRSVKFTIVRGEQKSDYSGKLPDDDHINGTVIVTTGGEATEFVWKAERRKDLPK